MFLFTFSFDSLITDLLIMLLSKTLAVVFTVSTAVAYSINSLQARNDLDLALEGLETLLERDPYDAESDDIEILSRDIDSGAEDIETVLIRQPFDYETDSDMLSLLVRDQEFYPQDQGILFPVIPD